MRSISLTLGTVMVAALVAAPLADAQTAQGVVASAPGVAGAARTVEMTATITKIDAKTRAITLKGPQGSERTVVATDEVRNFGQLKVGDKVDLQVVEALVVELRKGSTAAPSRTEKSGVVRAPEGGKPGGVVGRKVTVVGEVVNVDAATQMLTVRGPNRTVDFRVADPEQFKLVAKGDRIEATYTEAAAIAVRPSAQK